MVFVDLIAVVLVLLFSVTIHEYAHGWVADKLGDTTPRDQGRLTLNPLSHLNVLTTIVVPLLIIFSSRGLIPPLARAKPIRINPYHFKNPRQDLMLVSAAGPLSNIGLALVFLLLAKTALPVVSGIFTLAAFLNFILAVFNFIPIPPLDGSRIVAGLLPIKQYQLYRRWERFGYLILGVLMFFLIISGFLIKGIAFLQNILFSL